MPALDPASDPPVTGAATAAVRSRLAAARLWAATRFPYLATAIFASPVVDAPGIGTVAVDEQWRLHVDPEVAAGGRCPSSAVCSCTTLGTCCAITPPGPGRAGVDADRADQWADAADAEINDDLIRDVTLPGEPVLPGSFGCQPGRLAEEYFHVIAGPGPRRRRTRLPTRSRTRTAAGEPRRLGSRIRRPRPPTLTTITAVLAQSPATADSHTGHRGHVRCGAAPMASGAATSRPPAMTRRASPKVTVTVAATPPTASASTVET